MSTLLDYILWLGDYPFSAVPFQEVDAIILCLLAYIDYSTLFEHADEALIKDCQRMIDAGTARVQGVGKAEAYIQILKAAASSRRFGALRMTDYVDILVTEVPIQFSAIIFHDDSGWSFIAYRGTDNTLAGWKEDFMISFTLTQAQELAREFAENHISPDRTWYIGGHSKGGNLALYAARKVPADTLSSIKRVFLLDGPGFCPEVLALREADNATQKITRIIPGFSVIGRLFEPKIRHTCIIRSSASGFLQHDIATWGVDHGKPARLFETDSLSNVIHDILNKWIGDMKQEDRKTFVNDIFNALGAGGAKTLDELVDGENNGYEAIMRRFQDASESTKRIIRDLSRQTIHAIFDALFHIGG